MTLSFGEHLQKLMDERDVTYRDLEKATKRAGRVNKKGATGLSNVSINMLATGRLAPTIESMEILAAALNVDPNIFADYRLLLLRNQLDPRVAGFEAAVSTLRRIEDALDVETSSGKE